MTQPDPRAEILRAVGEHNAADILEKLDALEQPTAPTTTEAPTSPVPATTPEQHRQQEGEALLARLNADTKGQWASVEEPAR